MKSGTGAAIRAALVALRDELSGAGLNATVDRKSLRPPGAWVTGRTIPHDSQRLDGSSTLQAQVWLVVGAAGGDLEALDRLGELLDLALTVVQPDDDIDTAAGLVLAAGSDPLPAYRLTVDLPLNP